MEAPMVQINEEVHLLNLNLKYSHPGGPHVGPTNFAIWAVSIRTLSNIWWYLKQHSNSIGKAIVYVQFWIYKGTTYPADG